MKTEELSSGPVARASATGSSIGPDELVQLNTRFEQAHPEKALAWAWERFGKRAAIGTSFQGAGLVAIHIARAKGLHFPIFTLDTGLLFPETLELKTRLEDFFGVKIEALRPQYSVHEQAQYNGPELWKRDPDLCCSLRKVLPLRDKLAELDCWITGLRRQQSEKRADVAIVEHYAFDEASGRDIIKLNPMATWTRDDIWAYIRNHRIPYNPLHDRGYRSIGCHPCTRQTRNGEHERAGRWTGFQKAECGIHTFLARKDKPPQ